MLQSFCDGRLFAERTGHAHTEVVGLHGWARSREDLTAALAGFNALAIDLPGFGASPEPPSVWDSRSYAAFVAEALASLDSPQVLLGHSFGGRIAVKLAAWWPELVSGLVLSGVPLLRPEPARRASPQLSFRIARWGSRRGIVSERMMEKLRRRYGSEDYKRASGVMRSVLVCVVNESYEKDLSRITCPVELVWGSNDTAAPLAMAQQACSLLPDARLEVIQGAGHMTPLTAPDALRGAVNRLCPRERAMIADVASALAVAAALGGTFRWLRIAQREHYLPGSVSRFAARWWRSRPENVVIGALLIGSAGAAWAGRWEGTVAAGVISLAAPFGLSYRGRSGKLVWTRRLRSLAATTAFFIIVIAVLGFYAGVPIGVSATLAVIAPIVVDSALFATAPLERRLSARFVKAASSRLREISPRVVAVTGSYGKTSTKFYAGNFRRAQETPPLSARQASTTRQVSPGQSMNVSTPATEAFVAEMGTYGPARYDLFAGGLTLRLP